MDVRALIGEYLGPKAASALVPGRILIVDDDEGNLAVTAGLLEDDYEVTATSLPREALGLIEKNEYDLVLSDQRMPEVTGVELLTAVHSKAPETVRVIVSAFSDSKEILACINQGHVYRYIIKPWDPDEMESLVRQALDHRFQRLAIRRLVTELRSRNEELALALDNLKKAQDVVLHSAQLSTIGHLTSSIAHELKNQLGAVRACYDLLQEEGIPEHMRELTRLGGKSVQSVLDMVKTINLYASRGSWDLNCASTNLRSVVEDAVLMARMDTQAKQRRWEIDLPEQLPPVSIDGIKFGQALLYLLRNAIEATPSGGTISVRAIPGPDVIILRITDTGCGIPETELAHVFDPFFSSKGRSVGLGLPIAKQVAEAHGARMLVSSVPGNGTVVEIAIRILDEPT
jgi:signal transduction histidine kinase